MEKPVFLAPDINSVIRTFRGFKVILDSDLAAIYGVPTFRFNEAVRRNIEKFPDDFLFQLTKQEYQTSRWPRFSDHWPVKISDG